MFEFKFRIVTFDIRLHLALTYEVTHPWHVISDCN